MGLKQKAIRSVAWNTVAKVSADLISIAQLAVVARYIDKADFGLMSTVHVVLGLVMMFSDLGMYAAMMHKQDITENQYSSIYWMNWAINIFLFLVICAIAYPVALFYHESRLTFLIILSGSGALLAPFGKIFATIKQKNLEFGFLSKLSIFCTVVTFVLTVLMCVLRMGVLSLIIPSLIAGVVGAGVMVFVGRKMMPIHLHFSFEEIREMFSIGMYNTATQILNYLCYKLDVLLLGKLFGMETLGIYNIAKELAMKAFKVVKMILGNVVAPLLSKFQDDHFALEENYLMLVRVAAFICFPILIALSIFSGPTVELFFSAKYASAAPYVSILCYWAIFSSVDGFAGQLVIATGRTDLEFYWTIVRFICVPIAVVVASQFSPIAIAWSQVFLQIFFFPIYWYMTMYKTAGVKMTNYVGAFLPALICSILAAIPSVLYRFIPNMSLWIDLMGGCSIFAIVYLLCSWLINRRMFSFGWDMVCTAFNLKK